MNNLEIKEQVEKIRSGYETREVSKAERLEALDKKVHAPAKIFAYIFGSVATLVFGTGMCLCLNVIGTALHPAIGIAVGVAGMALCGLNYLLYKKILKKSKEKHKDEVLKLCEEALNGVQN